MGGTFRLLLDSSVIISSMTYTTTAITVNSTKLQLLAGRSYNIRVEYVNEGGSAEIVLSWITPSTPSLAVLSSSYLTSYSCLVPGFYITQGEKNKNKKQKT
jgi:hypothetical protein